MRIGAIASASAAAIFTLTTFLLYAPSARAQLDASWPDYQTYSIPESTGGPRRPGQPVQIPADRVDEAQSQRRSHQEDQSASPEGRSPQDQTRRQDQQGVAPVPGSRDASGQQERPWDTSRSDELRPFGHEFFDRVSTGFEPIPELPAPAHYLIGSGDELRIVLSSPVGLETEVMATVDPMGRVRVPNVGFVTVQGRTIEAAEAAIASSVRGKFPALTTHASIRTIRPIQVFVIGEVQKPGAYVLPGMSTLLNALYASGGPNETGSLRKITIQRNRKTIATVDLYDILLHGNREKDITLESGDSIFVPAVDSTFTMKGEVRRKAIYEMLQPISIRQALQMAGGATGKASLQNVRVERVIGSSRKFLVDLHISSPDSADWEFPLQNGDVVTLEEVLDDPVNHVSIFGQVRRPGMYEISENMTLSQLVRRAEGFTPEEVYLERATIHRTGPNGEQMLVSTNLGQAMAGDPEQDVALHPRDRVIIYALSEAASLNRTVRISGEVARPGTYDRRDGMRLRDLIISAGGATTEAYDAMEVATMTEGGTTTQTLNVSLQRVMAGEEPDNLLLGDGDHVSVRDVAMARRSPRTVTISGEVEHPGTYAIVDNDERISSLIARAGGLTGGAFPEGTIFTREAPQFLAERQLEVAAEIQRSEKELTDQLRELEMAKYGVAPRREAPPAAARVSAEAASAAAAASGLEAAAADATKAGQAPAGEVQLDEQRTVEKVASTVRLPIDLPIAMTNPGSDEDLPLEDGDTVVVPKKPLMVSVAGAVVSPSVVVYKDGKKIEDYIREVGGYARDADEKKTVVVRANGEVRTAREVGQINLGDIIIVPPKALTAPRNRWETVADFARIAGNLALTILVATN